MSDIRALVADQVIGVDEIAQRFGPSLSTVNMWTRGAVPAGAPPFPLPAKVTGKVRFYIADEVEAWISKHHRVRG